MRNRILSLVLTASLALYCFTGCAEKSVSSTPPASTAPSSQIAENFSYPIEPGVTLTCFSVFPTATSTHEEYEETPFMKELAARTGVTVDYTWGTLEQFNVMVASGVTYDLLQYNFLTYPGGPEKAIKDKVIISLNDVQEHTPNLNKVLADNPEWDKQVKTDNGTYYVFPFFRGDLRLQVFQGGIIRQDWLDELKLEMPETIEECEAVLQAFKDKKGSTAPLCVQKNIADLVVMMGGAYKLGSATYFLNDDNKISYAPYTSNYKELLTKLNEWYEKGLIDPSYGAVDRAALDANMVGGASGLSVQYAGGGIGRWMQAAETDNPEYNLAGMPCLVMSKGEKPYSGQRDNVYTPTSCISITSACKNPEAAARYLDYGYSEEGYMYNNFGIEGVTYNLDNGKPVFTDLIMKNPDGLTVANAMYANIRGNVGGTFVQDVAISQASNIYPSQTEAVETWSNTDAAKHILPQLYFTEDEAKAIAKVSADINTFVNEKTTKFIVGAESIDLFDDYMQELKELGIEDLIEYYEAAYARYQAR